MGVAVVGAVLSECTHPTRPQLFWTCFCETFLSSFPPCPSQVPRSRPLGLQLLQGPEENRCLGRVIHTCNSNPWEVDDGEFKVVLELYNESDCIMNLRLACSTRDPVVRQCCETCQGAQAGRQPECETLHRILESWFTTFFNVATL